jgi:hypothetical protein
MYKGIGAVEVLKPAVRNRFGAVALRSIRSIFGGVLSPYQGTGRRAV